MLRSLPTAARLAGLVLAGAAVTGCATDLSGSGYSRSDVGVPAEVYRGRLLSVQKVELEGTRSGTGTAAGAIAGGALGSTVGGGSAERVAAGVAGAVIGGLIGSAAENATTRNAAFRYLIELQDGRTVSITQADDQPVAAPGQDVLVEYGSRVRVTPAF